MSNGWIGRCARNLIFVWMHNINVGKPQTYYRRRGVTICLVPRMVTHSTKTMNWNYLCRMSKSRFGEFFNLSTLWILEIFLFVLKYQMKNAKCKNEGANDQVVAPLNKWTNNNNNISKKVRILNCFKLNILPKYSTFQQSRNTSYSYNAHTKCVQSTPAWLLEG